MAGGSALLSRLEENRTIDLNEPALTPPSIPVLFKLARSVAAGSESASRVALL